MVKFTDYGGLYSYMEKYSRLDLIEDLKASAADTLELAGMLEDPDHYSVDISEIINNLEEMYAILNELIEKEKEVKEDG